MRLGMFQLTMDIIPSAVIWPIELVYLHDIVICSNSRDEHIDLIQQVLTLLNDAGLTWMLRSGSSLLIAKTIMGMSSSQEASQSAQKQSIQLVPYRHRIMLWSYAVSLFWTISFTWLYSIFNGSAYFQPKNCKKHSHTFTRSYPTKGLNLLKAGRTAHFTSYTRPSIMERHVPG